MHVNTQEPGYAQLVYLRDAVVSYGRPFSTNRGIHTKKHNLEEDFIPNNYLELHREIIRLRNTLFAHSDIAERNPCLVILGNAEDEIFVIESEPVYLSDVKENLANMASLIIELRITIGRKRKELENHL